MTINLVKFSALPMRKIFFDPASGEFFFKTSDERAEQIGAGEGDHFELTEMVEPCDWFGAEFVEALR